MEGGWRRSGGKQEKIKEAKPPPLPSPPTKEINILSVLVQAAAPPPLHSAGEGGGRGGGERVHEPTSSRRQCLRRLRSGPQQTPAEGATKNAHLFPLRFVAHSLPAGIVHHDYE